MFTGLVQAIGEIHSLENASTHVRIGIRTPQPMDTVKLGDSIAVDGVCLTVTGWKGDLWFGDISHETLRVTTLGKKKVGMNVHLERALRMGDPLGGHMVQGHVDCIGEKTFIRQSGESWDLGFSVPEEHARFLVPKGSVAIDGVSLTVNWVKGNEFGVTIIPHTSDATHLTEKKGPVNIETDIVGKYIVNLVERTGKKEGALTYQFLAENGYTG